MHLLGLFERYRNQCEEFMTCWNWCVREETEFDWSVAFINWSAEPTCWQLNQSLLWYSVEFYTIKGSKVHNWWFTMWMLKGKSSGSGDKIHYALK